MSPAATFLFATALAAACATPGPTTTALVARVLARGLHGAALLCVGLLLGDVFWLLCATLGVAALAQQFYPVSPTCCIWPGNSGPPPSRRTQ
jgi:threonine/homoserine/homoserine lactone efflux protein